MTAPRSDAESKSSPTSRMIQSDVAYRLGTRPVAPRATCSSRSTRSFWVTIATLCLAGTSLMSESRQSLSSRIKASLRWTGSERRPNSSSTTATYDFEGVKNPTRATTSAVQRSGSTLVVTLPTCRVWPILRGVRGCRNCQTSQSGSALSSCGVEESTRRLSYVGSQVLLIDGDSSRMLVLNELGQ